MITLAAVRRALRDHRPQVADAPDARPAAVALVVLEGEHGLEILLIRRAERDLSSAERLGVLDDLYPRTPALPPVVVRPFVFALARRSALMPSDEVQRAFWLPLVRLSEPGVRREVTLTLRGAVRVLPAYVVDDEMIWGMTERIVTPFVDLISNSL